MRLYEPSEEYIFTNRGESGVTSNDGLKCVITRVKPKKECLRGEQEYVIRLENGRVFGVRHCELTPIPKKEEE